MSLAHNAVQPSLESGNFTAQPAGQLPAPSGSASPSEIAPRRLTPRSLRVARESAAASGFAPPRLIELPRTAPAGGSLRIGKRDVLMVVTQLSIMLRSGVDLAEAVRSIAERAPRPAVRHSLGQVHAALESGSSLSKALTAQRERFGSVLVASVAAGEASGRLPEVLTRISVLLRDELRLQSTLRSVISYPAVLVVVTFIVLGAMIFFVLPQFAGIYEASRAPTPVVTKVLLDGAQLVRGYWWVVLGVGVAGVAAAVQANRSAAGRRWRDQQCFRLPVLRGVCRSLLAGRLFRLQGALLETGVPLLEVLQLTRDAVGNTVLQDLNDRVQRSVLAGKGMASELVGATCIPDGAGEMISTAEAHGQLAGVLQTVGEFFESEGEQQLRDAVKIAEPAIIVVLGLVVGLIVLAVMLPLLDLSTAGSM